MARMASSRTLLHFVAFTAVSAASVVAFPVNASTRDRDLCTKAIAAAARDYQIPKTILTSIALVESGMTVGDQFIPWPWTINFDGKGRRFNSRSQVREYIDLLHAAGEKNYDVGCFQINFRWHGVAFDHPSDLLNARENTEYAAFFLRTLFEELGSWDNAVAAFHSRNTEISAPYLQKVKTMSARLASSAIDDLSEPRLINKRNTTIRGQKARLGSLFSATMNQ